MSIGTNVRILRERANITQEELSKKMGITQSMLSQIEKDIKALSLIRAKDMAEILGCSVEDILAEQ